MSDDDRDDPLGEVLAAFRRLPAERQREITIEMAVAHDPTLIADAIASAIQQWKRDGMSEADIRSNLDEACAELGIDRKRGLN